MYWKVKIHGGGIECKTWREYTRRRVSQSRSVQRKVDEVDDMVAAKSSTSSGRKKFISCSRLTIDSQV